MSDAALQFVRGRISGDGEASLLQSAITLESGPVFRYVNALSLRKIKMPPWNFNEISHTRNTKRVQTIERENS